MVDLSPIGMLVLGILLFAVAPKIIGFALKILGVALVVVGLVAYKFPPGMVRGPPSEDIISLLIIGLPIVGGVFVLTVGQGMAKLAVRIAGVLLIVSALMSMGILEF